MFSVFFVRNKIIENFMICIDNLNDDVNSIKYIINILIEFRVILQCICYNRFKIFCVYVYVYFYILIY